MRIKPPPIIASAGQRLVWRRRQPDHTKIDPAMRNNPDRTIARRVPTNPPHFYANDCVHLPGRLQGTRCREKPCYRPCQVQRLVRRETSPSLRNFLYCKELAVLKLPVTCRQDFRREL